MPAPTVVHVKFGDGTLNVVPAPQAPTDPKGRPVHVVIVMDVSGSMQLTAAKKNANGEEEKFANSVLDLVKYATKAVYSMLGKEDYFTLITYGSDVTITMECIEGGADITTVLDGIHTSGCTNMGGGLKAALDCVLRNEKKVGEERQSAVMLLTDGAPNEGLNAAQVLESFRTEHTALMARTIVNTYAFGYAHDLAGDLMFEIATKGNGSFGYIPDVGFLGTVFIHSMINLRSTTALLPQAGIHNVPCEQVRCGISDVKFNETRASGAGNQQSQSCLPENISNVVAGKTTIAEVRTALQEHQQLFGDGFEKAVTEVFRGIHAQKVCKAILECIAATEPSEAKLYALLESNCADLSAVPHLSYDVEQQVAPAFRPEYFRRWGKQYVLSFVSAHLHQQCNNFKDKSVEVYKTPFALARHEEYDDIFNLLEPPKPTVTTQDTVRITSSAQINSSRDPCVHQDSRILMASGSQKAVKDIMPGELVRTANGTNVEIDHIIRTQCKEGKSQMVCFPSSESGKGLRITPWHPVMVEDSMGALSWTLPLNAGHPVEMCECDYVYSFTVKGGGGAGYEPGLVIEGVPVVHLAHGRSEPAVLSHPFFGTDIVTAALPSGSRVHTFDSEPVLKGTDGMACGWDMEKYMV